MSLFAKRASSGSEPGASPAPKAGKSRRPGRRRSTDVIRIEELEQLLAQQGDASELDPDAIVSLYMPHRRARQWGAALLQLDRLQLALMALVLVVAGLFIAAFLQEKMGNFTINLNRLELFRKGIAIDASGDFNSPTARLTASTVQDATNITLTDLPDDVDADSNSGDHNGANYMAYTYYIRNAGKEDVGYQARITLDSCSKGAEDAVRVVVWHNGERTVYAEPAADGEAEEGCVNFESHDIVCTYTEENFLVGNVDKYTIVIFMEGEDPECVDAIVGGSVEFSMSIDAVGGDDSSLLTKFLQDIRDTLTGDKPIDAAGTEAPGYYDAGEVTWDSRLNQ